MLKSLVIRNIALIEYADLSFSEGINILSGETGAGKSVILDSIEFVLGAKADKSMIRHGEKECSVRAEFDNKNEQIELLLREFDLEPDDTLIISRQFSIDGKGGAKINGSAVSTSMLRKLTSLLIDVHGQSEHFYLLNENNQLNLLDRIAGKMTKAYKVQISELLCQKKEIQNRLLQIGIEEGERNRKADVLRFQIDEIERAALKEGEAETLKEKREKLLNAEKICEGLNIAKGALLSDGGVLDMIVQAKRALHSISKYGNYEDLCDRLDNVFGEVEDIGQIAERFNEELEFDETSLEKIENRIDEIKTIEKKYGGSISAAKEFLNQAKEQYQILINSAKIYEESSKALQKLDQDLYDVCSSLTRIRKDAAVSFTGRVIKELKELNIPSAKFEIQFDEYGPDEISNANQEGMDHIRFLFSANVGEPLKGLNKIISGGEMSRFMLAIKAQLNSTEEIGTYIFDEIDAGIGGRTAKVVAEKFCNIAKHTQIIAISHSAQIASCADRHFLIEKCEQDQRTKTFVKPLTEDERRSEIARLLVGDGSKLSLMQAGEILERMKKYKNSL